MNRRNFIKTLGLATTGLLFPFNTLSNNIDPEVLEVYNFVVNKSKEINNPDFENISKKLLNYLSDKYSIESLYCIGFGHYDLDGILLYNNPYIKSKVMLDIFGYKECIIQKYKSKKFDQIYITWDCSYKEIKKNIYQIYGKINFGRFNTINQTDFDFFANEHVFDLRKSKLYNPVLTFNIN